MYAYSLFNTLNVLSTVCIGTSFSCTGLINSIEVSGIHVNSYLRVYSLLVERFFFVSINFKGGFLDFSHLTELKKNIYITEIYRKKKKTQKNKTI